MIFRDEKAGKKRRQKPGRKAKRNTLAERSSGQASAVFLWGILHQLIDDERKGLSAHNRDWLAQRLLAWYAAAGDMTLEEALGLKLGRGLPHPLADVAKQHRHDIYTQALAKLFIIGFTPKQAVDAVHARFRANPEWQTDARWERRFPKLPPLSEPSVLALTHNDIIYEALEGLQNQGEDAEAIARDWPRERARYPEEKIPWRFK